MPQISLSQSPSIWSENCYFSHAIFCSVAHTVCLENTPRYAHILSMSFLYDFSSLMYNGSYIFSESVNDVYFLMPLLLMYFHKNCNYTREWGSLYYYMKNYCNLIGLEQWYFSLIWNTTALSQSNCSNFSCSSINSLTPWYSCSFCGNT